MREKEKFSYCVMCCCETEHVFNSEDEFICKDCENIQSDGIAERDEIIETLSKEKTQLTSFLKSLGYSKEQIEDIECSNKNVDAPEYRTPFVNELEAKEKTSFIVDGALVYVDSSEDDAVNFLV